MMRIFLLLILILPLSSYAEYDVWNFRITVITLEGEVIDGYGRTAKQINPDSLSNTSYLLRFWTQSDSSIPLYQDRISYENTSDQAAMNSKEYVLFNRIQLSPKSVESISISQLEIGSSLSQIATQLSLSDTSWMHTTPKEVIHIQSTSCEFDIFVHEEKSSLQKLIQEFKTVSKKPEESTPNRFQIQERQRDLVKKLDNYQVVVIRFCTC